MNCNTCGSYFPYGFGYGKNNNELCEDCYSFSMLQLQEKMPIKPYLRNGKLVRGHFRRKKNANKKNQM